MWRTVSLILVPFFQATTTLVSMADQNMVRNNCKAVLCALDDKEVEAKEAIHKLFFEPLTICHWDGVEVEEYWKSLK